MRRRNKVLWCFAGCFGLLMINMTPKPPRTTQGMSWIPPGKYLPLYSKNKKKLKVKGFWLDQHAVTNQQFLNFVRTHPRWRKSRILRLFAEKTYLYLWAGDLSLGPHAARLANSPVVYVSWFPAKAYCRSLGKRLPRGMEWEYAASASRTQAQGRNDPGYTQRILRWYSKPTPPILPPVKSTFRNYWGVYDMHGLIWEWVLNFNTSLVTGESRGDSALERKFFCGSGSVGASDFKDYAAFMRFAFRSSLKYNYTTANLGFRCAKDAPPPYQKVAVSDPKKLIVNLMTLCAWTNSGGVAVSDPKKLIVNDPHLIRTSSCRFCRTHDRAGFPHPQHKRFFSDENIPSHILVDWLCCHFQHCWGVSIHHPAITGRPQHSTNHTKSQTSQTSQPQTSSPSPRGSKGSKGEVPRSLALPSQCDLDKPGWCEDKICISEGEGSGYRVNLYQLSPRMSRHYFRHQENRAKYTQSDA